MEIAISDFGGLGKRVTLVGRLDILGAGEIEGPLTELAASKANIIVDMGGVDFIASIGMCHLVFAAKTVARSSRTSVLLNPTPLVANALTTGGIQAILPIVHSEEQAQNDLSWYAG